MTSGDFPRRHPAMIRATIFTAACLGVAGGMAWAVERLNDSPPPIVCNFSNETRQVTAKNGWGVGELAVRVSGIDSSGPKSACYNDAQNKIVDLNPTKIDPSIRMLHVGEDYTIPIKRLRNS